MPIVGLLNNLCEVLLGCHIAVGSEHKLIVVENGILVK